MQTRLKAPFHGRVTRGLVCLHVTGASTSDRLTFILNLESGAVVRGSAAWLTGKEPWLELSVPASIIELLLEYSYDPFSALYSYRVAFKLAAEQMRSPKDDTELLVAFFVDLFAPALLKGVV